MSMPTPTNAPALKGVPLQREIPGELDRLTAGIDRLEGVVSDLQDRLSPVLRDPTPTPGEPASAMPQPGTTISRRVQDEYRRVARLTETLGDILGRCEL